MKYHTSTLLALLTVITMTAVAHADSHTIHDIRADVIALGVIPDTYLIEPTGDYWDANGGDAMKRGLENYIDTKDRSSPADNFQSGINRALFNQEILLEGRVDNYHEVVAFAVAKERAQGTYSESGYLKKYHDYIIDEYNVSPSITEIDSWLNSTLGDMLPLAGAIRTVGDRAASMGGVPFELWSSDPEYWFDVEWRTICGLGTGTNGLICASEFDLTRHHGAYVRYKWIVTGCLGSDGFLCNKLSDGYVDRGNSQKWPYSGTVPGFNFYTIAFVENSPDDFRLDLYGEVDQPSTVSSTETTWHYDGAGGDYHTWGNYVYIEDHPCYQEINLRECLERSEHLLSFDGYTKVTVLDTRPDPDPIPVRYPPNISLTDTSLYTDVRYSSQQADHVMDASGTTDPDGDNAALRFNWVQNLDPNEEMPFEATLSSDSGPVVSFPAPNKLDSLDFTLTVTDADGLVSQKQFTVTVNTDPHFEMDHPDPVVLLQYLGVFFLDDDTARPHQYNFLAKDPDSHTPNNKLEVRVAHPPDPRYAVLVSCETPTGLIPVYTGVYDQDDQLIRTDYTPLSGSVCLVALEAVEGATFRLYATDGVYAPYEERTFTIKTPAQRLLLNPSDVASIVPEALRFIFDPDCVCPYQPTEDNFLTDFFTTSVVLALALFEAAFPEAVDVAVEVWRCEQGVSLVNPNCATSSLGQDSMLLSASNTRTPGDENMGWEAMADDAGGAANDNIIYEVGQPSTSGNARSPTTPDDAARTLYDFSVEPGRTYHYAMRITVDGTTSSLIPMGSVTAPIDDTKPWIMLYGERDTVTSSPYIEPGYDAIDNYDMAITDSVVATGMVDHTVHGKYYLYYDVTDSAGNMADTRHRSVTIPGTSTYTVDNPPPAPSDVYRIILYGEMNRTIHQGVHADLRADCQINGETFPASRTLVGSNWSVGVSVEGSDVMRPYWDVGNYTVAYSCGSSNGDYEEMVLYDTFEIFDAPPEFDWTLYPDAVICHDSTDGVWIAEFDQQSGIYTCEDSVGHVITATGPPS